MHHALGVRVVDSAKAQRIHHGHRAGAHGNDVAHNAAHTGRGTLVRLHEGRVVVGFDLKGHGPAVADVRDAGVLADAHHEVLAHFVRDLVTELAQVHLGGLVRAVLGPHDRVHGQFRGGGAAAQDLLDPFELGFGQPQLGPWQFDVRGGGGVFDGVQVEVSFAHVGYENPLPWWWARTVPSRRSRENVG